MAGSISQLQQWQCTKERGNLPRKEQEDTGTRSRESPRAAFSETVHADIGDPSGMGARSGWHFGAWSLAVLREDIHVSAKLHCPLPDPHQHITLAESVASLWCLRHVSTMRGTFFTDSPNVRPGVQRDPFSELIGHLLGEGGKYPGDRLPLGHERSSERGEITMCGVATAANSPRTCTRKPGSQGTHR